jgi:hypothetical protein
MSPQQFLADYMAFIDILAILALVVLAGVAFSRNKSILMLVLGVVVVCWVASRFFRFI